MAMEKETRDRGANAISAVRRRHDHHGGYVRPGWTREARGSPDPRRDPVCQLQAAVGSNLTRLHERGGQPTDGIGVSIGRVA